MYVIMAQIELKPQYRDVFLKAYGEFVRATRDEPDNMRFDLIRDASDANRLYTYEVYVDVAAYEIHLETVHALHAAETTKNWFAAPVSILGIGSNILPSDDDPGWF